jgi:shikimate kinase
LGLFVYLYVDTDELYRRISQTGRPAFLTSDDPRAEFMRLAAERDEVFRKHADVIVDLDALGPVEATDRLVEQLREHGFGGQ